ncbi:zinc finger CCCH domain-containing protein 7A [Rhinophrynus dorsalis]
MSCAVSDRRVRQEEIKKGLQFIQSSLPYLGSQEEYEIFVQKLVKDLYNEGNDLYREGYIDDSINQYLEALSIADYAVTEDICIPNNTLERLYVNRAASYLDKGFHEKALKDCEAALSLNDSNLRALYRKSKALFMIERYREAYNAIAKCSLIAPQDESVVKLTQDLAVKLGLKIRKAYIRAKPDSQMASDEGRKKDSDCLAEQIEPDLPEFSYSSLTVATEALNESDATSASSLSPSVYSIAEVGIFPSAQSSNGAPSPFAMSSMHYGDGDGDILGDELDKILDSVPGSNNLNKSRSAVVAPVLYGVQNLPSPTLEEISVYPGYALSGQFSQMLNSSLEAFSLNHLSVTDYEGDGSGLGYTNGVSPISALNTASFPGNDSSYLVRSDSPAESPGACTKTFFTEFLGNGTQSVSRSVPEKGINPLEDTHEFTQACQQCFTKAGSKGHSFTYNSSLNHECKRDFLLGRIKSSTDASWKKIRPRPTKAQYVGPYYICKDVAQGIECTYPGVCTFAYSQEEIDVWTMERKGSFCREALFGENVKTSLTIPHLLQEYQGLFMFLCEKCFNHRPRIISKEKEDNPAYCSHPVAKHDFEDNKCLVHIIIGATVKYYKIRPYDSDFVLDICRHEVRYGCLREEECFYAHSLVELRVWVMQKETGISHDVIVRESKKHSGIESSAPIAQVLNIQKSLAYPKAKIKFVCGQCWRNGQVIEPDKNRKYCSAKARHLWTKDHRIVLVMSSERKKWISIRPFPGKKPVPVQFDLCHHIVSGKKCQYIGNCSFAHSPEEKEIWTFMKDHGIQDMDHLYEKLMKRENTEKGDGASSQVNKQIHLPTDYAETKVDFHCWLCGKICNSERQWKMHISSDKHKEKVFHCEDDQNIWQHRFPTGCLKLCERFLSGVCSEGEKCKFAHGKAELKEWRERTQVLCQKLIKARKDQLIGTDDNDFGKYSFLVNGLN